ncbi:hypothetical protein LRR18_00435 [Mangrovimonas sp. AS39]|uniref:hypothetical protein n=1 Tax=Mangrovimonas futianensis TaxID=2895523 RepID=UPI001E4D9FB2|nr:hypothetical protein [Mangrovimonas futianensis]MCF1190032.1 hypothetical protein [Mangrovimonas futianensis]MCF1194217.1 hypothetical protein [Mangrovimonas futianensis]
MNNTLRYWRIFLFSSLLLPNCSSDDNNPIEEETVTCPTQELGITFENNQYTYHLSNPELYPEEDLLYWRWRKQNDTIEVSGVIANNDYSYGEMYFLFSIESGCPEILLERHFASDDYVGANGNHWDYFDNELTLQEYSPDERLVCFVDGENNPDNKIWIEFTPELENETWRYNLYTDD